MQFDDAEALADDIIREVGKTIVLALPLGIGKANHVANALYARAVADPAIDLCIFTALTPEVPKPSSDLERRFLDPFLKRVFGGYPALAYAEAAHAGRLPPNVEVNEFFFLAGRWLSVPSAQRNYISANYTHAQSYILARGVNVVAQLVAKRVTGGETRYGLGGNTDITLDLLKARQAGKIDFKFIGQVNSEMPFMPGAGDLSAEVFSHVLDSPATDFPLFSAPKEPISLAEYATGFHIARLIADGGTLQIGIGQIADAAVKTLILRHRDNATFARIVAALSPDAGSDPLHHDAPFDEGLYGVSEMFVEAFLELVKAGILKREVDGVLLHAAFFLGTRGFYRSLREMDAASLAKLRMTAISFTNDLYGDEATKRRQRVRARFVNNAMMVTLLGAVVSDALEDGRVVSGVGGQYNFVAQAFELEEARSIIALKSTRGSGRKLVSNILWSYGHETIPRHLRDIVVTEYGVADLRGKSDRDVIAAMLSVADSRFQPGLLKRAKASGKIEADYEIPPAQRQNTPERIAAALGDAAAVGLLPAFPFGSDFTATEERLLEPLQMLKSASPAGLAALALGGLFGPAPDAADGRALERLGLDRPRT
ncbi:MAG TPA: acetyl-CoA hydrolase/transferase C-terminal domain-containing protein, partial [Parvibaculum sp.]